MTFLHRAWRAWRRDGTIPSARRGLKLAEQQAARYYRSYLWPHLPTISYPVWNGVRVARPRKLLDSVLPTSWQPEETADHPAYESALVAGLADSVAPGDTVVVIGGGYGVTVVQAARLTGATGSVVCYEAAIERVSDTCEAVRLNRVTTEVEVVHAIVGREISLFGTRGRATLVSPAELPECDVLEMDCEGAEMDILTGLTIRPRVILVETHGLFGAATADVGELLDRIGYDAVDLGVAERALKAFCLENDVRVLAASRRDV